MLSKGLAMSGEIRKNASARIKKVAALGSIPLNRIYPNSAKGNEREMNVYLKNNPH